MSDRTKTREDLIEEITRLRAKVSALETAVAGRKEMEVSLYDAREGLEIRVQKRTSELARVNVALQDEIEEHKKTEEKLRESQERYRSVVDNIGIGVALISPGMEILTINKQMSAWFPLVNPAQKPLCYCVFNDPPRDAPCSYCPVVRTLQDGCVHETVTQTPAGSQVRNYRVIASPIKDKEDRVVAVIEMVDDVTEHRRAGSEVLMLKKQMEFVLGTTKTGLDIIDSDFNIRYMDPQWAQVYGPYKGRKCYEYFMFKDAECPGCGVRKALETRKPVVTEEILLREGNRPIQVTSIPFQNENGEWLVAEVNVDITERKKLEDRLRRKIRHLERLHKVVSKQHIRRTGLKKKPRGPGKK